MEGGDMEGEHDGLVDEDGSLIGMDAFVNALQDCLESSDLIKRTRVATALEVYSKNFPAEIQWATSECAPGLLWNIMHAIHLACLEDQRGHTNEQAAEAKGSDAVE
jgi:hypothetical protein